MSETVIVTGGAGYIGSHTCKALKKAGFLPVAFDNLSTGRAEFAKWGPLVEADIRNAGAVARAIVDHKAVAVVHFAAASLVAESMVDPAKYYDMNVRGTLGLLDGMRAAECDTLVLSSTAAVYGQPDTVPIGEEIPLNPVNPYGRSKLMCEAIVADFAQAYGLKFAALRYFNAAGDDPDGDVGENRALETHLIPRALMALQGYVHDFQVFGSDFDTPDGTAIRDYIHVSDLAQGHVLALAHIRGGGEGGVFNLGTGRGYSVGEVLSTINDITGRTLPAPRGDRRAGDPPALVADAAKAKALLGFAPALSDLETIVRTAWHWHQSAHPLRNAYAAERVASPTA